MSRTASKVGGDLSRGLGTAVHNIERVGLAAAGLAVGGGAAAVKWAGDFQAGMETINTVAFASAAGLEKAGEGLRQTFRDTGQSMADLQSAEYDLVSAGVKLSDAQTGVNTAVRLGIGALGSTAEAVDVLTTAINSYNLKAKDGSIATATWTRLSDELAQAVADGKVKLSEIAAAYAVVAPVAAQAGIKTGEIAAALGYLTARGVPAAEVLTQMNRAIVELSKPKGDMAKVLKALGESGTQLISQHGLAGALQIVRDQAAKMKIPFIDLFGRIEAYKFALQTTGTNQAGFAAEMDRIAHSAGMTSRQFDERAQGLNYQLGVLKANVQDAGITIGSALLPQLTDLATQAADFLRGHQQDVADFAKSLAGGFRDAVAWAKRLDWGAIGDALRGLAGFGKALAEGFMGMPTEVKAILLGLFGANRLTGGAVVKVGVDLAGGLAGALSKAVGSGLAGAGLGKLFVQPVFVTNPGFGAGGLPGAAGLPGAGGSLLGTVMKVALVGIAAGVAAELAGQLAQQSAEVSRQGANVVSTAKANAPQMTLQQLKDALANAQQQRADPGNAIALLLTDPLNHGLANLDQTISALKEEIARKEAAQTAQQASMMFSPRNDGYINAMSGGTAQIVSAVRAGAGAVVRPLDTLHRDFAAQLHVLRKSADPAAVARAAARAAADVAKGVGGVSSTAHLLATLRRDRALVLSSGDKGLLAKIDAAIKVVADKLPRREWVAGQLAAAQRIAKSAESADRKDSDLKAIQQRLLSHGVSSAAAQVGQLRRIAAKKTSFSITNVIPITTNVSIADVNRGSQLRARYTNHTGFTAT